MGVIAHYLKPELFAVHEGLVVEAAAVVRSVCKLWIMSHENHVGEGYILLWNNRKFGVTQLHMNIFSTSEAAENLIKVFVFIDAKIYHGSCS